MDSMSDTTAVKSDQINAADLIGAPITVTISGVKIEKGIDQPVSMSLRETPKVYRPCKIMRRVIVEMWGDAVGPYIGRSLTLYCDPNVRFGKDQPGGTRISHMSHIADERVLTTMVSKGKFAPHRIKPLVTTAAITETIDPMAIASAEAAKGAASFRTWYVTDAGKDCRASGGLDMNTLQGICAKADAAREPDPFGLPPVDATPSPEELAQAEAAAMAVIKAQEAGQ